MKPKILFLIFLGSLLISLVNPGVSLASLACGGDCPPWQRNECPPLVCCICRGVCIETPKNPRYYDNPTYSDRPDKNLGPKGLDAKGLKLPIKLDWDDVPGFKENDLGNQSLSNLLNKLPGGILSQLPLGNILNQLSPALLNSIPAAGIISELPLSILTGQASQSVLNQLSFNILGSLLDSLPLNVLQGLNIFQNLPLDFLNILPADILRKFPLEILSTLPGLPVSTLKMLPIDVLEELLPINILSQMPVEILMRFSADTLRNLPVNVLNKLPISFLRQLPISDLNQLPRDFLSQLPIGSLEKLPVDFLKGQPIDIIEKLPLDVLAGFPVETLLNLPSNITVSLHLDIFNQIPTDVLQRLPILGQFPLDLLENLFYNYRDNWGQLNNQLLINFLIGLPQGSLINLPIPLLNILPTDFLNQLPLNILQQFPIDFLNGLPINILGKLPLSFLRGLPIGALIQFPFDFLKGFPLDILNLLPLNFLDGLSGDLLKQLPLAFLQGLPFDILEVLPLDFLMGIPLGLLTGFPLEILGLLPLDFLMGLPLDFLAGFPLDILNNLPLDFISGLPGNILAQFPIGILNSLPSNILNNIPGIGNLNVFTGGISGDCPEIYVLRIENVRGKEYKEILKKSEWVAPYPCFFEPDKTYKWHVKACCDNNQSECGKENNWEFTTSDAPEPKLPYDPDWNGIIDKADNQPLEITLRWCQQKISPNIIPPWPQSQKLLFYIIKGGQKICHPLLFIGGKCVPELVLPSPELPMPYEDSTQFPLTKFPAKEYDPRKSYDYFSKDNLYSWQVSVCKDPFAKICTDWSQEWRIMPKFALKPPALGFPPDDPKGEKSVGFPLVLSWQSISGVVSVVWEIKGIGSGVYPLQEPIFDYPKLGLNTIYAWRVKPCWDDKGTKCESFPTRYWYFKTTGGPPKENSLNPAGPDVPIPVNLEWENVGGAKSFVLKIQGTGLDLTKILEPQEGEKMRFSLDYPEIRQETQYTWQVKTCARAGGELCGNWSSLKQFTTFRLPPPGEPSVKDNEEISFAQMPMTFSWQPALGAKYYQYTINYLSKSSEETGECPTGKVVEKTVSSPNDLVSLNCLGEYQLEVAGCLDADCQEIGEKSQGWNFTLTQAAPAGAGGLVPCGRNFDNPDTPWNEREPCQIRHLFLSIKILIDFLFQTLIPIILVLLILATGIISYVGGLEGSELGLRIKSIWKSVGWGLLIIFFAWLIVTILLPILGFKTGIFGPWWKIQF